jgi:excisionase family DNA binding protein
VSVGFLSSPEVSAKYSIPLRTVQAACSSGSIPATRFGRMWLISPEDAQDFAERWRPRKNGQNGNENE